MSSIPVIVPEPSNVPLSVVLPTQVGVPVITQFFGVSISDTSYVPACSKTIRAESSMNIPDATLKSKVLRSWSSVPPGPVIS